MNQAHDIAFGSKHINTILCRVEGELLSNHLIVTHRLVPF